MLQTTIFEDIEKSLKQLPHFLQVEVFHYIEFLKSNYVKKNTSFVEISREKKTKKRDGFGIWKGKITMSDDFDSPMEEFSEYM